ncbi:hypothetical protein Airi02_069090 [Actinoallomurus iriomotensis]|uniref:Uncharacterized protein n=1 Tax=Actinoallomurus iriomotensis TaxID=478107 RepID=A0A9W6S5Y9_9ACTN|nr:hypothetical protein Airi02_069090 [Actinoallomurus iriomotensis]
MTGKLLRIHVLESGGPKEQRQERQRRAGMGRRRLGERTFTSFFCAAATDVIFTESPQIVRVISATDF